MAVGVVDQLELVEVQAEQRQPLLVTAGAGLVQHLVEKDPVGQLGQAVVTGQKGDLFLAAALRGDVRADAVIAREGSGLVEDRLAGQRPASLLAVDDHRHHQVAEGRTLLDVFVEAIDRRAYPVLEPRDVTQQSLRKGAGDILRPLVHNLGEPRGDWLQL